MKTRGEKYKELRKKNPAYNFVPDEDIPKLETIKKWLEKHDKKYGQSPV